MKESSEQAWQVPGEGIQAEGTACRRREVGMGLACVRSRAEACVVGMERPVERRSEAWRV